MALDIVQLIKVTLGVLHTFVRFLPLGFYFFTYLTSVLFKDRRAAILLGGLVVNDLVGFSMKKYFKFEPNEVYAVDIAFSTGDGKPKEKDAKTTVYKRAVEQNYRLKMKASRYLFNEINKKYPSLPFSITSFDDLRQAKMGTVECTKHDLLHTYPVLYEKEGDFVAHVKFTVFVMEKKTSQITININSRNG